jgi:hypothetical protein
MKIRVDTKVCREQVPKAELHSQKGMPGGDRSCDGQASPWAISRRMLSPQRDTDMIWCGAASRPVATKARFSATKKDLVVVAGRAFVMYLIIWALRNLSCGSIDVFAARHYSANPENIWTSITARCFTIGRRCGLPCSMLQRGFTNVVPYSDVFSGGLMNLSGTT